MSFCSWSSVTCGASVNEVVLMKFIATLPVPGSNYQKKTLRRGSESLSEKPKKKKELLPNADRLGKLLASLLSQMPSIVSA